MTDVDEATKRRRERRASALKPLFDTADGIGMYRAELARRLDMTRMRLWRYENGWDRVPTDFITRACQVLRVPETIIRLDGPVDVYIQQPRGRSRAAQPVTSVAPAKAPKATRTRKPANSPKERPERPQADPAARTTGQRRRVTRNAPLAALTA